MVHLFARGELSIYTELIDMISVDRKNIAQVKFLLYASLTDPNCEENGASLSAVRKLCNNIFLRCIQLFRAREDAQLLFPFISYVILSLGDPRVIYFQ